MDEPSRYFQTPLDVKVRLSRTFCTYHNDDHCMIRSSKLASRAPTAIAQSLTQGLRDSGALSIAEPMVCHMDVKNHNDITSSATNDPPQTQFTQSLMLFVCPPFAITTSQALTFPHTSADSIEQRTTAICLLAYALLCTTATTHDAPSHHRGARRARCKV